MLLCANPGARYTAKKERIDQAVQRVLTSGWYILGKEVETFEAAFASYCDTAHAIGVGSGTEALHLALGSLGIGSGDEVITVSHTATATVSAIELAGATPVLVDIEPDYFTIDPKKIEAAMTTRTRAIMPVHLYGQAADMAPIMAIAKEHSLKVIEDCAQAHGATYRGACVGGIGDMGCFSFYPTKNLGAIGDGGMVVTNDAALCVRAQRMREYGWDTKRNATEPGWNTRLDEIQAAILNDLLPCLDQDNARRQKIAAIYDQSLEGLGLILPRRRDNVEHVFHLYVVETDQRDALIHYLRNHEIAAGIHYAQPTHLHDAYRGRIKIPAPLINTECAADRILSLPMYPELLDEEIDRIIAATTHFFGDESALIA
jgi:dTDP-4-amino-4,6-dideoxygalactose transaminase